MHVHVNALAGPGTIQRGTGFPGTLSEFDAAKLIATKVAAAM
jgi:hypothetical protein